MRILVVAATALEIAPILATLRPASAAAARLQPCTGHGHDIDVLTTGVGMVATAAWCSRVLAASSYHLAMNVGVCGSFDPALGPGAVLHVTEDCLPELGAEDGAAFLTIQEMGLLGGDEFPFRSGRLRNEAPPAHAALRALPEVRGITVNTVHGHEASIASVVQRYHPQVESMEGAAFMYACLISATPFAQVRAVSNVVERRNRAAWKMSDAVTNLGDAVLRILNQS